MAEQNPNEFSDERMRAAERIWELTTPSLVPSTLMMHGVVYRGVFNPLRWKPHPEHPNMMKKARWCAKHEPPPEAYAAAEALVAQHIPPGAKHLDIKLHQRCTVQLNRVGHKIPHPLDRAKLERICHFTEIVPNVMEDKIWEADS